MSFENYTVCVTFGQKPLNLWITPLNAARLKQGKIKSSRIIVFGMSSPSNYYGKVQVISINDGEFQTDSAESLIT